MIIKYNLEQEQFERCLINNLISEINPHYDDVYFSREDGCEESEYIFIDGNNLKERLSGNQEFHIGETGFGTGLNLLTLLHVIRNRGQSGLKIKYSSLEKYPLPPGRIHELLLPFSKKLGDLLPQYEEYWTSFYTSLQEGWNRDSWSFKGNIIDFNLFNGDALMWSGENFETAVDAWFLDGHSPDKNPEIWSAQLMNAVFKNTASGGTLASFTASGIVKRPLRDAGFFIKRKKGFGAKRHMIQGIKS